MLKINPDIIRGIRSAETASDLYQYLQSAIELEHATIPPYLTAMFSFNKLSNREIWDIIHSVVIEEMLHMTIAANILNSIGGSPLIYAESFVPDYPSQLPMNIGDGLEVSLAKYSKDQVKNVFMEIEMPENPINFPRAKALAEEEEYNTIGEFYQALIDKLKLLPPEDFNQNPEKQVTSKFFSKEVLFEITNFDDAERAINIIIEQGEGTSTSPIDGTDGDYAHYYKFEELYVGKRLIKDDSPKGYSFTGPDIPFDESKVNNVFENVKAEDVPEGSEERELMDQFNLYYSKLLLGLDQSFNGEPELIDSTISLMYDLKLFGEKLCATPLPSDPSYTLGPSFEFVEIPVLAD